MSHLTVFETNYSETKENLQQPVRQIVESVLNHPDITSYRSAVIAAEIIRLTGQLYKEDVIKIENMFRKKPVPRIADAQRAAKAGEVQKDCITCPDNLDVEKLLKKEIPGVKPIMSRQKREALAKEQANVFVLPEPLVKEDPVLEPQVNDPFPEQQVGDLFAATEPTEIDQKKAALMAVREELDKLGIKYDKRIQDPTKLLDILDKHAE